MIPLFNAQSEHVGWIYGDNIFDVLWNWIAFMDHLHTFSTRTLSWLGPFSEGSLRDRNSKPVAWREGLPPSRGLQPSLPVRKPSRPVTPFIAWRPAPPATPPVPFTPIGGWSPLSWQDWMSQQ